MTTLAIDPSTVDHVLPDKYWGFNFSIGYYSGDLAQSSYISLMKEILPEVFRAHDFKRSNGALYAGFNDAKYFFKNVLPNAAAILNPDSGPDNLPSNNSPCVTSNLAPNGSGRSPQDHANLLAAWLDAGIDVQMYEFDNEPWGHCVAGPRWYGTVDSQNPDGYKCETWVSIHQRDFWNALEAIIAARGKKTEVGGHVISTSEGYSYGWTQAFINADAIMGSCISPIKGNGANLPFFDTYVFHGYPASGGGGSSQDRLNSLLTDQASPPSNGTSLYSKLKKTRAQLDAVGGQSKGIAWDECGIQDVGPLAGLFDAVYAIIASRYQKTFNIKRFAYHSANTTSASGGIYPVFLTNDHVNFNRTVHSNVLRDIVSPFIRNYKHQAVPVMSGENKTPGTYPVDCVQSAGGVSADGKTLGILLANVHLANAQQVTINLNTVPGNATVTYMLNNTGAGGSPTKTLSPSGSSFTFTMEPGSVYFLEIPISVVVTPPAPGPTTQTFDFTEAQAEVELFRAGSPHIASAFDKTFKALNQ